MILTIMICVVITILMNIGFMYKTAKFLEGWLEGYFDRQNKATNAFINQVKEEIYRKNHQKE